MREQNLMILNNFLKQKSSKCPKQDSTLFVAKSLDLTLMLYFGHKLHYTAQSLFIPLFITHKSSNAQKKNRQKCTFLTLYLKGFWING